MKVEKNLLFTQKGKGLESKECGSNREKNIETQLMRHVLTSFYSAHNFIKRHLLTSSLSEKLIFSINALKKR